MKNRTVTIYTELTTQTGTKFIRDRG